MINIHILELLASKICHDLISPVGAINNGLEFIEEMGPQSYDDAKELLSLSTNQASAKLQAYRLAYGAGGADSTHTPQEVYNIIQAVVESDGKITQIWNPKDLDIPKDDLGTYPTGFCKLLISVLLLALKCLPKGGTLDVDHDGAGAVSIEVTGPDGALREGMKDAMNLITEPESLHPNLIHAYVCGLLAKHYRHGLDVRAEEPGNLVLSLTLP